MTFDESIAYLRSLEPRGWRLGLDRMAEFARRASLSGVLGHSPEGPNFIHVAGTNGKGSVTAYLQSIFVESGFRTGAFFSPFVYDVRERVQYGRDLIPKDDFARITTELQPIAESLSETEFGGVTEFELKTAIGFQYWAEKRCEWVALEVGLGGRLDSTNIVDPACSIVVSIGLDHVSILGDTLAKIAYEKAGVIKPGRPVVVGALAPEAMEVMEAEAARNGSPLWRLGQEIQLRSGLVETPAGSVRGLVPGITGAKQAENAALAVAAVLAARPDVREEDLLRGVARASAPGRFERRRLPGGSLVILDGAHNADAAVTLRQTLDAEYPGQRFALITGMVQGHDPGAFYEPLAGVVGAAIAPPIDFHRAIPPVELQRLVALPSLVAVGSVEEAVAGALSTGLPILVTGSFYLVGAVGPRL